MRYAVLSAVMLTTLAGAPRAAAVAVRADELAEARRWSAGRFRTGGIDSPEPEAGLIVLANHGVLQRDARGGRPLRVAGRQYRRGLYCHAPSKVLVRLPGPGAQFTAVAGVDSNSQTQGGRGSVIFSVAVNGAEAFRSDIMREGMPGTPVSADLGGASEFLLEVADAGDGIACDQADWAEARVVLADGAVLWLGTMPMFDLHPPAPATEPPFSFTYDGRPSTELLPAWPLSRATAALDGGRTQHTLTWTDPDTGLAVECVAVEWPDFPTVEWTLHFTNTGAADTPILEDIQSLDIRLERPDYCEFVLHHNKGDSCSADSFEPRATTLEPKAELRFAPAGGRPSSGQWPYYNVEWLEAGVIIAIGWPGQWASAFSRDEGRGLRVRAGQELTRFRLHPGERARTPLSLLQFYSGDWIRAQNVWRRFMFAHTFPQDHGKPLAPKLAGCSGHHFPGLMCNQAGEIEFIDRYLAEEIPLDYWWMDAGWYPCDGVGWPKTGTWEVDPKRYPGGLRAVTDHAHARGLECVVWFEPERVHAGTWLAENRPQWIFGGAGGGLLNLGEADARQWVLERVDRLITEQGIDLYRQDFNIDPLAFWRGNDPPDRQGLTEMRHVEGYLAWWDELRRRHPGMLIDSCASGGRRNDLETMRRAVPLLRTDFEFQAAGNQCHTYGFDMWLPFHEVGNINYEPYMFRSNMGPMMGLCWDVRREDLDYALIRRLVGQWRQVADCYFGDMYPLTGYSTAEDVWMAWQFDRPDLGRGLVQAFRRAESIYEACRLPLLGLDPDASYEVIDLDRGTPLQLAGRELADTGLRVEIAERPGAVLITYRQWK